MKNFYLFLNNTEYSEKTLDNFKEYMQSTSSSTAKFAATLKSVAANMAIMLAINLVVKGLSVAWDEFNTTALLKKIKELEVA